MSEENGSFDPILGIWWFSAEPSDSISEWTLLRYMEDYYEELQTNPPSYQLSSMEMQAVVWGRFESIYLETMDDGGWISAQLFFHRISFVEE
jgi:hypothetical protein